MDCLNRFAQKFATVIAACLVFLHPGASPGENRAPNPPNPILVTAYSVGDLPVWRISKTGVKSFDPSLLIELIRNDTTVKSQTEKGLGEIRVFKRTASLVVRNRKFAHERIAEILANLRSMRKK